MDNGECVSEVRQSFKNGTKMERGFEYYVGKSVKWNTRLQKILIVYKTRQRIII